MNTKNQAMSYLAAFAVRAANDVKDDEIKNGRILDVPHVVEYLEGVPLSKDLTALIRHYLTNPNWHAYEVRREGAKARRAEKEAANAKIYAEFGL